jgi:hypothetical protein
LTKSYVAKVDDADYERVLASGPWFTNVRKNGKVYAIRNNRDKTFIYMHQVVTGKRFIDHKNNDGLDNQSGNLRSATKSQNAANIHKDQPFKGTTFDKTTGMWKAAIMVDGKHISLGRFPIDKRKEAAEAYAIAAVKYFGEFAHAAQ